MYCELSRDGFDGERYQARFDVLAAAGADVHGEATFVMSYAPESVLDAGCGPGRFDDRCSAAPR